MFVVGALAFWAPEAFAETLDISLRTSTVAIGVVTLVRDTAQHIQHEVALMFRLPQVCGVCGTAFGGWLLDQAGGGRDMAGVAVAMKMGWIFSAAAAGFALMAVLSSNLFLSLVLLAMADFLMFATGEWRVAAAAGAGALRSLQPLQPSVFSPVC